MYQFSIDVDASGVPCELCVSFLFCYCRWLLKQCVGFSSPESNSNIHTEHRESLHAYKPLCKSMYM